MRGAISPGLQLLLCVTLAMAAIAPLVPVADGDLQQERLAKYELPATIPSFQVNKEPWRRSVRPLTEIMRNQVDVPAPLPDSSAPNVKAATPAEPPPRPQVPAHGFTYLGLLRRDGTEKFFLQVSDQVEIVAVGEMVTPQWRLESSAGRQLQLRYLPLDEVRTMQMGDAR